MGAAWAAAAAGVCPKTTLALDALSKAKGVSVTAAGAAMGGGTKGPVAEGRLGAKEKAPDGGTAKGVGAGSSDRGLAPSAVGAGGAPAPAAAPAAGRAAVVGASQTGVAPERLVADPALAPAPAAPDPLSRSCLRSSTGEVEEDPTF